MAIHLALDAQLDFSKTFAFNDFKLDKNPMIYEYSNIDGTYQEQMERYQKV